MDASAACGEPGKVTLKVLGIVERAWRRASPGQVDGAIRLDGVADQAPLPRPGVGVGLDDSRRRDGPTLRPCLDYIVVAALGIEKFRLNGGQQVAKADQLRIQWAPFWKWRQERERPQR